MSDKKQRNTIITDWLEKHGDPEIDKKVEQRLEQITREIMSEKKQTKIDVAINDTKLRLNHVEQEIMLMIREKETLKKQLDSLETIRDSKHYE